jgi:hypothetical protein
MKGKLAGLAMAAIAACGLMLGGCVADAGDEEEAAAVATSPNPAAPGQITPGLKPQDTLCNQNNCEPEPQPWVPTAKRVVPVGSHHGDGDGPASADGIGKSPRR